MEEKKRIEADIEEFYKNIGEIEVTDENREVIELAKKYCEDAKYFLWKNDLFTAWGCINYAHGLIDAFRKKRF